MKNFVKDLILGLILGVATPATVLQLGLLLQKPGQYLITPEQQQFVSRQTVPQRVTVSLHREDGSVVELELEEYLLGAVLGEMPAYFETEALKAQSVAARTYALKAVAAGKHGDGSVCTNPSCCQAYIDPGDYLLSGGEASRIEKVRCAVEATSGLVLTYEGELIEATYFSCSGGRTEDAVAVWGTDYPYLKAVDSPGEEAARWYSDTVTFPAEEFLSILGVSAQGDPESWFGTMTYTSGGGVDTIVIADTRFRGTDLRMTLGLRSTCFEIETTGDCVIITTKGYGHRVGMSQYGAEAMAVSGSTFRQILQHYYPGTRLEKWKQ